MSWTLALLWSVYSRGYSMGCVVATSFIFSETSGSSFDTNINRILGVGMGLAVGNVPAILILSGTSADTSSMLRFFAYFVVMFIMWTLAMFGYLAPGSKYYRACLLWAPALATSCYVAVISLLPACLVSGGLRRSADVA